MFTLDLDFYTLAIAVEFFVFLVVFSNFMRKFSFVFIFSVALLRVYRHWKRNRFECITTSRERETQSHFMYGKHLVKFPQSLEKCRTDYARGERIQKIIFIIISTRAMALHAFDATSNRIIHLWFYGELTHTLHSTQNRASSTYHIFSARLARAPIPQRFAIRRHQNNGFVSPVSPHSPPANAFQLCSSVGVWKQNKSGIL